MTNVEKLVQKIYGAREGDILKTSDTKLVCLCGSTKFKKEFEQANRLETGKGHIVLSVAMFGHHEGLDMNGSEKQIFDQVHMKKILICDEVLVLNVGGYIGSSTAKEIAYAKELGKPIRYLEAVSH